MLHIVGKLFVFIVITPQQIIENHRWQTCYHKLGGKVGPALPACSIGFTDIPHILHKALHGSIEEGCTVSVKVLGQITACLEVGGNTGSIQHGYFNATACFTAGDILRKSGSHFDEVVDCANNAERRQIQNLGNALALGVKADFPFIEIGVLFATIFHVLVIPVTLCEQLSIGFRNLQIGSAGMLGVDHNILEILDGICQHKHGIVLGQQAAMEVADRVQNLVGSGKTLAHGLQRIVHILGDFKGDLLTVFKYREGRSATVLAFLQQTFLLFHAVDHAVNACLGFLNGGSQDFLQLHAKAVLCDSLVCLSCPKCHGIKQRQNIHVAAGGLLDGSVYARPPGVQRNIDGSSVLACSADRHIVRIHIRPQISGILGDHAIVNHQLPQVVHVIVNVLGIPFEGRIRPLIVGNDFSGLFSRHAVSEDGLVFHVLIALFQLHTVNIVLVVQIGIELLALAGVFHFLTDGVQRFHAFSAIAHEPLRSGLRTQDEIPLAHQLPVLGFQRKVFKHSALIQHIGLESCPGSALLVLRCRLFIQDLCDLLRFRCCLDHSWLFLGCDSLILFLGGCNVLRFTCRLLHHGADSFRRQVVFHRFHVTVERFLRSIIGGHRPRKVDIRLVCRHLLAPYIRVAIQQAIIQHELNVLRCQMSFRHTVFNNGIQRIFDLIVGIVVVVQQLRNVSSGLAAYTRPGILSSGLGIHLVIIEALAPYRFSDISQHGSCHSLEEGLHFGPLHHERLRCLEVIGISHPALHGIGRIGIRLQIVTGNRHFRRCIRILQACKPLCICCPFLRIQFLDSVIDGNIFIAELVEGIEILLAACLQHLLFQDSSALQKIAQLLLYGSQIIWEHLFNRVPGRFLHRRRCRCNVLADWEIILASSSFGIVADILAGHMKIAVFLTCIR